MNKRVAKDEVVIAETKYLRLVDRDGWSFVQRTTCTGVVCIVPVTIQREIILIEQFRAPLGQQIVELPAGLVGDTSAQPLESLEEAARRELLEETGYTAGEMRELTTTASCPGLTDETVTFFLAERLAKQGTGGGDASEEILVHIVPLAAVDDWLKGATAGGKLVDARVYSGLYLLTMSAREGSGL